MQRPSQLARSATNVSDQDGNEIPVLTPIGSVASPFPHRGLWHDSDLGGPLSLLPTDASYIATLEAEEQEMALQAHRRAGSEQDTSALFDTTGRSLRHTRGGVAVSAADSHLSTSGMSGESVLFSPLLGTDALGWQGNLHGQSGPVSALRTPTSGRSPVRLNAHLSNQSEPPAFTITPEPPLSQRGFKVCSLGGTVTPPAQFLSLPSSRGGAGAGFRGELLRTPEDVAFASSATQSHSTASATDENVADDASVHSNPDWALSRGVRTREVLEQVRLRDEAARKQWWATVREVLFYFFIASCSCCLLFSWMMHRRHISFVIPAHHRKWSPAQKSTALFRSGLYYLILALICRFDEAWLSLFWLFQVLYGCVRGALRMATLYCERIPWYRLWHVGRQLGARESSRSRLGPRGWESVPGIQRRSATPRSHAERDRARGQGPEASGATVRGLANRCRSVVQLATGFVSGASRLLIALVSKVLPGLSPTPQPPGPPRPRRWWRRRGNAEENATLL